MTHIRFGRIWPRHGTPETNTPAQLSASPAASTAWHALSPQQCQEQLATSANGLTTEEALARQQLYGLNRLTPPPQRRWWTRLISQLQNMLIYVLLLAAVMSLVTGHATDAAVILAVVVINALFGVLQEGKAEQALASIRNMLTLMARVSRDGQRQTLDAELLVPGDVIHLESGDKVPADLRVFEAHNLLVQESALTGESSSVGKQDVALALETPLAEQSNLLFAGTLITQGRATGWVVRTGDDTELGRIGSLLRHVAPMATPLTRQLDQLGQQLSRYIVLLAVVTFLLGWLWRDLPLDGLFMAAVSLAVAAIPEGLPAVVTIALAIGVQRLAQKNAIIRQLPAVETLGAVSVICTDKTGTLTRNEMVVRALVTPQSQWRVSGLGYGPDGQIQPLDASAPAAQGMDALQALLHAAVLCNDAHLQHTTEGDWHLDGDPTEGALLAAAQKADIDWQAVRQQRPRLHHIPFESASGFMATAHAMSDQVLWLIKGAPEQLISRCLATEHQAHWRVQTEQLAQQGLRVLALAQWWGEAPSSQLPDVGWQWLGLIGMQDPPRQEAANAIAECQQAGIHLIMITGDHISTAKAIASQLGLAAHPTALTGRELDALDDASLRQRAVTLDLLARATPANKLRLVQALQAEGHVVAMTGDGVNDAPALRQADIGVAMGRGGTEAAKEAADMVLADDNIATLRDAVRRGRNIYSALQRTLIFLLPTNGAQALVLLLAILCGWAMPISPLQILWINMVSAITLALPLAFEPLNPDLMRHKPRPAAAPLLQLGHWVLIALAAVLICLLTLAQYHLALLWDASPQQASSLAIQGLVICEMFFLINCRRLEQPTLNRDAWLGNHTVWWSFAVLALLQLLLCYLPVLQQAFATRALSWRDWGLVWLQGLCCYLAIETVKWLLHDQLTRPRLVVDHHAR